MELIDINPLKKRIDKEVKEGKVLDGWAFFFKAYLDSEPHIDIDRPQGEWIDEVDKYSASFGIHDYRCSNCNSYADEYIGGHEWYTAGKPNFCPHCGADMKGVNNE